MLPYSESGLATRVVVFPLKAPISSIEIGRTLGTHSRVQHASVLHRFGRTAAASGKQLAFFADAGAANRQNINSTLQKKNPQHVITATLTNMVMRLSMVLIKTIVVNRSS